MKKIFYFVLVIISFVVMTINVYADTVMYITDSTVNFRSGPGTGYESIGVFSAGDKITLLNTTITMGTGCTEGWFNISYNNKTGYICSKYVTDKAPSVTYGRPWTTPKKAIVGGAQFISQSYISKGQFTSYLKKFNVNPNSSYTIYNHQYMANLAAPYSEASSSFNAYDKNGLLNLPLHFTIPVYLNMPDSTYNSSIRNIDLKTSGITDQAFEDALNAQNFPESYKDKLRYIHTVRPNWTFTAMHTGLYFSDSVVAEKKVCSIEISTGHCEQNPYKVTESGWCIANDATTSFYLDPRNFLNEKYILMFENLAYSANYTESVVQSVINNTHMSGISILDNQSFASIFVEAGLATNVSPVYLASLARQETGVNGSTSTSGTTFTYKDQTYTGLYNYFNIGASSGESNPVLAGLVWAGAGYNTIVTEEELKVLNALEVNKSSNYIMGYEYGTTLGTIKGKAGSSLTVNAVNYAGNALYDGDSLGTGSVITVNDGTATYNYTLVIYGDATGDGLSNSADLLKVRQHLLGTSTLTNSFKSAADTNKDGQINSADLLQIRRFLLGLESISQK